MKKKEVLIFVVVFLSVSSCSTLQSFFKSEMTVAQAIMAKDRMDKITNPAQKDIMYKDLQNKIIVVPRAKVLDIIESINVDYSYAVIARVETEKGPVDLYLYSKDQKLIASLSKESSEISAKGEFSKFFQLLDDSYAKIELVKAKINKL